MEVNWFLGGKEEEEDDGEVVVVGMEEEMEERMVEELVAEMVVEKREKVAGHGKARGCFMGCHFHWLLAGKGRRKEIMKEREGRRNIYKGVV